MRSWPLEDEAAENGVAESHQNFEPWALTKFEDNDQKIKITLHYFHSRIPLNNRSACCDGGVPIRFGARDYMDILRGSSRRTIRQR